MYWSLLWVVLLLVAFGGLALWLQRRHGVADDGPIQVEGVRRLDANHTLWIIAVDGRRLVVGSGREGLQLIAELDRP